MSLEDTVREIVESAVQEALSAHEQPDPLTTDDVESIVNDFFAEFDVGWGCSC